MTVESKPVGTTNGRRPRVEKTERPTDIDPDVWELGQSIGNVAMAAQIIATDNDVLPSDPDALNDFLVVTSSEANKALRRYVNLNRTIGKRLSDAFRAWKTHKDREQHLFLIIANGGQLPDKPDATPTGG